MVKWERDTFPNMPETISVQTSIKEENLSDFPESGAKTKVSSPSLENPLIQKYEQEIEEDKKFLGMYDQGFDAQKLLDLEKQVQQVTLQINEHRNSLFEEREALQRELQTSSPPLQRLSRMRQGERPKLSPEFFQKQRRLQQLMWGLKDDESIQLQNKKDDFQRQLYLEKDKCPDFIDVTEAERELRGADLLPTPKYGIDTRRSILMKTESAEFKKVIKTDGFIEKLAEEISTQSKSEVWFHTTKHLGRMLQNGGISTTSWLQKHDQEYHGALVENSVAQGKTLGKDSSLSSPLNKSDVDKIYFMVNGINGEEYGENIISFAPEDIMLDSGLYFYPQGYQHMSERVISDVVDKENDKLPENGASELQIALDRAYIAVPKQKYRETVRQLFLAGYSKEWIQVHTFSYRGAGYDFYKGQTAATREIKRRVALQRQKRGSIEMHAVPNPDARNGWTKVFQLSSKAPEEIVTV